MKQNTRERIFTVISKKKEICVNEIVNKTGFGQSLVSHHLRNMKNLDLIKSRVAGKQRFYSVKVGD